MCPDRDQRAERFDELWERRRAGEEPVESDPELEELLEFARWLDENLPEDFPDPEFRATLKEQLLSREPPVNPPIDLAEERWYRRFAASGKWMAIGVSAVTIAIILAVVLGPGVFTDDQRDASLESATVQATEAGSDLTSDTSSDTSTGNTRVQGELDWGPSELPPLTPQHVVLNPLLSLSVNSSMTTVAPAIELGPEAEMPELPDSALIYYFNAPSDPQPILTNIQETLGLDAELVLGDMENGIPYQLLNESGEAIVRWDAASAYFGYYGSAAASAYVPPLASDPTPEEIARAFLETIGFDLSSIEYEARADERGDVTHVVFKPVDMPEMDIEFSLGATVDVASGGTVAEAHGFWFSLIGSRETDLQAVDEAWERSQSGEIFWPPHDSPSDQTLVEIETAELRYLLTRYDEGTFVLQPAVTFVGEYGGHGDTSQKKDTRCYVPAAEEG